MTWQATPRNKIAGTYKVDKWCTCPNYISATRAPEAAAIAASRGLRQEHVEWTSTMTNRLMVEAVGLHLFERWGNMDLREQGGSLESRRREAVCASSSAWSSRGAPDLPHVSTFNNTLVPNYAYRPR